MAHDVCPIPRLSRCSLSRAKCEAASRADPVTAKVSIDAVMHTAGAGAQAGLCVGSARSGLDGQNYELHSALLRTLDTTDADERWARGEDAFAGCKVPAECRGSGLSLPVLRE